MVLDPMANMPPLPWLFRDVTRDWTITLSQDTFGLETRSYAGFDDFRARFERLSEALVEHIVPTLSTRIGLRFLDELRPLDRPKVSAQSAEGGLRPIQWDDVVCPEMLGIAGLPMFQGRIQQSLQQLALRDDNGVGLNINHGIVPAGSLIDPPSAGAKEFGQLSFYALDIDAFQEFGRGREIAVSPSGILGRLDAFHDAISKIFRWSLKEDHLDSL